MTREIRFEVPWPPSVNKYWRRDRGVVHISRAGREYREAVADLVRDTVHGEMGGPLRGDVGVALECHRPDRRRRDVDNILKALLDAITHAGIWEDDSQVVVLEAVMRPPSDGPERGTVEVSVTDRVFPAEHEVGGW